MAWWLGIVFLAILTVSTAPSSFTNKNRVAMELGSRRRQSRRRRSERFQQSITETKNSDEHMCFAITFR